MIDLSTSIRGALRQRQRGFIINPFRFGGGGGGGGDPDWANRLALLHFDGADGSTSFYDEKLAATWTGGNTAQIDTAQSRYGGASLLLASGDYVETADASGWAFGTNDFFIECSIRPSTVSGVQCILSQWGTSPSDRAFIFYLNGSTLTFAVSPGPVFASAAGVSASTWSDVACGRIGNNTYVWLNGVRSGTSGSIGSTSINNPTSAIRFGTDSNGGSPYAGHIDEARVSLLSPPGGNYTVSGPFPNGP